LEPDGFGSSKKKQNTGRGSAMGKILDETTQKLIGEYKGVRGGGYLQCSTPGKTRTAHNETHGNPIPWG